jgi:hypothetical protein
MLDDGVKDECWRIEKQFSGSGRDLVRIAGAPTEIRTECRQNTNLKSIMHYLKWIMLTQFFLLFSSVNFYVLSPLDCSNSELTFQSMDIIDNLYDLLGGWIGRSQDLYLQANALI